MKTEHQIGIPNLYYLSAQQLSSVFFITIAYGQNDKLFEFKGKAVKPLRGQEW